MAARLTLGSAVLFLLATGCAHGRLPEVEPAAWDKAARWPPEPAETRIVRVGEIRTSADILGARGLLGWLADTLAGEEAPVSLARPTDIAIDDRGRILVADPGLQALVIFDVVTGRTQVLSQSSEGPLRTPVGVATDAEGRIYVSDAEAGVVAVFDGEGRPKGVLGRGLFERPTGIAYDRSGRTLLVADTPAHVVRLLSPAGEALGVLGGSAEGEPTMSYPVFVAVGGDGMRWVTDTMNGRVVAFDASGRYVGAFGERGDVPGTFSHPKGLALDTDGHVYVADAMFDNVQIFEPTGQLLLYFGASGEGPGELSMPAGIASDLQDRIFVADAMNGRIQIFRYLSRGDP